MQADFENVSNVLSKLRLLHDIQSSQIIEQVVSLQKLEMTLSQQRDVMTIVGIDPGKKGAIVAMINSDIVLHKMPEDAHGLVDILSRYIDSHIFVELAQSMPGQGVSSMFNYGKGFGTILGVIATLKIPHTLVRPVTWAKVMHMGTKADSAKARSLEAVRRLFPHVNLVRKGCKKPDEGYIDALLICEYGRRFLKE